MGYGIGVVDQFQPAAVADDAVLLVQAHGGADRAADGDADPVRVRAGQVQSAVGERLPGGHHGQLGRAVHPADLLRAQPVLLRVEVDLRGDAGAEGGGVEEGDAPGGGASLAEQVPEVLGADTTGGRDPDPGDDHSPGAHARPSQS
ncbi:hypothetical protein GCM10020295_48920 [Streptomyces cinereospinus]